MAASHEKVIAFIKDGEIFEHRGDVRVSGSIGIGARVIITEGSLTIEGEIGCSANIELKGTTQAIQSSTHLGGMFTGYVSVGSMTVGGAGKTLKVNGNLGDNVKITSHNATFSISGDIGKGCHLKTHNGEISAKNVGENASLVSHNGDINCQIVGKYTTLKSHNGDIKAHAMAAHSSAVSHNGDVKVNSSDETSRLDTHNGKIYINGVRREKQRPISYGTSSIVISPSIVSVHTHSSIAPSFFAGSVPSGTTVSKETINACQKQFEAEVVEKYFGVGGRVSMSMMVSTQATTIGNNLSLTYRAGMMSGTDSNGISKTVTDVSENKIVSLAPTSVCSSGFSFT